MKNIKEYFQNIINLMKTNKKKEMNKYNETAYIRRRRNAIYIPSTSNEKGPNIEKKEKN